MIELRTGDHIRELVAPLKRNDHLAAPIVMRDEPMCMREYIRKPHPREADAVRIVRILISNEVRREQIEKTRTREPRNHDKRGVRGRKLTDCTSVLSRGCGQRTRP